MQPGVAAASQQPGPGVGAGLYFGRAAQEHRVRAHKQRRRRVVRAAGRVPNATMPELVQSLWNPNHIRRYNQFLALSECDKNNLHSCILVWLELCVLETKLERLKRMSIAMEKLQFQSIEKSMISELLNTREWVTTEHPQWLAFEVDGEIQIRPEQYKIYEAVIDNKQNVVVQLNMGLGKTRVIVPMLIMHWRMSEKAVVRLNFLPELIPEVLQFAQKRLTASSMLNIKLYQFPFHRDVQISIAHLKVMNQQKLYCLKERGAFFVTPGARCSLHLKQHELRLQDRNDECKLLEKFESVIPCHDVFDESDEIMRVKFQLVYAVGTCQNLSSLKQRCTAVRAVINALCLCDEVKSILADKEIAVFTRSQGDEAGTFFTKLRLIPGDKMDKIKNKFRPLNHALATSIIKDPPSELKWLTKFVNKNGQMHEKVLQYLTESSMAADDIISKNVFSSASRRDDLLALRGLIANGVLVHCLSLRWKVGYGVAPQRQKRIAIPFRAADTPAERSEFAHADSTLILSTLSYAFGGLTDAQIDETFELLLELNPNERKSLYSKWFTESQKYLKLSEEDAQSISSVNKIDLTNIGQLRLLRKTYRRNLFLIHYWLQTAVFPVDMNQYPKRLKATAWHLRAADGGTCVGFSGTNDQHRLLPLHMKQIPLPDAKLKATNGFMLKMLLTYGKYQYLPVPSTAVNWKSLLIFCVHYGASALIDVGALLAGVDLSDAADFLLDLISKTKSSQLKAVVFFRSGKWILRDSQKSEWPQKSAPVRERDAFVIFDEYHCRGSDMKLKTNAMAVLTLGPGMSKDKLMQAAGMLLLYC